MVISSLLTKLIFILTWHLNESFALGSLDEAMITKSDDVPTLLYYPNDNVNNGDETDGWQCMMMVPRRQYGQW